ncbi:class I SAM-dependent methyltransferase [Mycobacterium sp.]|uniref:class I SAM-dependent methyltransferase n=1 Tax=Mycobacterium sp. TaxID=1785 RepID=UPI000CB18843|nr:class I SAM-dependent methyltransferase [Mycobacterium sp.]PJE14100.1 MAG: SAM-dependent methyltransferase [Mycobacterium sp.]
MPSDYVYDQSFAEERTRLGAMESLWDPGTQALLDELGLGGSEKPWRCLEVGAGGGSLLHWMTGRGATVVAVDIDTRFIESLAGDAIEVWRLDIRSDELPEGQFDLVHSRLVLEHLPDRRQIIDRLAATLRPGGWMLIEDFDCTALGFDLDDPLLVRARDAILEFSRRAGSEPYYGRRVVADLAAAGLTEVRGEGRCKVIDSSTPGFDFFRLSFESLRSAVVDAGLISQADADAAAARFGDDIRVFTPIMMAGIGRRPLT